MDYFELLHLKREPFSNSPDPDFFYATCYSLECLHKLEIAIRLRRGLNLVLGEVGDGKTTLSRVLLKAFDGEKGRFKIHLILDPGFHSDKEMLMYLLRLFGDSPSESASITALKDRMQSVLFRLGVEEKRMVVLLVDEGQKLTHSGLEILRELLNFETNEYKLLQVVVFAQMEFWKRIQGMQNLLDRINLVYRIRPLSFKETQAMINHRAVQAGLPPDRVLFTDGALRAIYRRTRGHPRKIVTLCHHAILRALMIQEERVTERIVKQALGRSAEATGRTKGARLRWLGAAAFPAVLLSALLLTQRDQWKRTPGGAVEAPQREDLRSSENRNHQKRDNQLLSGEGGNLAATEGETSSRPGQDILHGHQTPHEGAASLTTVVFGGGENRSHSDERRDVERGTFRKNGHTGEERGRSEDFGRILVWKPREWFIKHPIMPTRPDQGRKIVVKPNDTLSGIVAAHYGVPLDPGLQKRIQDANRELIDPHRLRPGDVLILPPAGQRTLHAGFYAEALGWFPREETAESIVRAMAGEIGPFFIVRALRDGRRLFGLFKGSNVKIDETQESARWLLSWVDTEDVTRVLERVQ